MNSSGPLKSWPPPPPHPHFFFGGGGTKWWSYLVEGLLSTRSTQSIFFKNHYCDCLQTYGFTRIGQKDFFLLQEDFLTWPVAAFLTSPLGIDYLNHVLKIINLTPFCCLAFFSEQLNVQGRRPSKVNSAKWHKRGYNWLVNVKKTLPNKLQL